jgi:hypothetical protein
MDQTFQRLIEIGLAPEAAAAVMTTSRSAMESALRNMENEHGDIERYLTGPGGLEWDELLQLRQLLLGP